MPLRCLLFSSNGEVRAPIWQVLRELGIEGEYCERAVDAVERVTTQLFQIVITDWEDQPEAGFLLKTARDLKAAQRPLTLAIVGDEAKVPEALRAGANSVLLKPIRIEQARDTMSTACELIRSKISPGVSPSAPAPVAERQVVPAASKATPHGAAAAPAPARVADASEKAFRAGEFLVSAAPAPSAQFDTESDVRLDQAAPVEVEALTELEPMASAVETKSAESCERKEPITGWAALQERLTKSAPPKAADPPKNELLTYGDMAAPIHPELAPQPVAHLESGKPSETGPEAELFAYIEGEKPEQANPRQARKNLGAILCAAVLAAACVAMLAIPPTRRRVQAGYRKVERVARNWLNPAPVAVPQVAPQHETFTPDDDYKLPAAANIPDATTDASQIRVVPVIDPTVKSKNADASRALTAGDGADPGQSSSADAGQTQIASAPVKPQISPEVANAASPVSVNPPPPAAEQAEPLRPAPTDVSPSLASAKPSAIPVANASSIPSSLRSQLASTTPDASGAKPVEAAMSAIEPVNLPESAAWDLLAQKVDPAYPDAAKAAGQRGSVALQVLIGRDGVVQDAKFLQGSLIFARAAIDAVRQWRFKPYLLNGRPVSVQSVVTLNFKP